MAASDNPGFLGTLPGGTAADVAGVTVSPLVGNPVEWPNVSLLNAQRASVGAAALAVPATMAAPTATAGSLSASVAFVAPSSVAPITSYTVTSSPGGVTKTGTSTPIVVTGLTQGQAYTFTIKATNIVGDSTASPASNSATPTA